MKNFTYKLKSKKAFTLVELVVTIAILSITAGFGIGIFASALRQYSSASVTAKDQETALAIEDFIVKNARVASEVKFLQSNYSSLSSSEQRNKAGDQNDNLSPFKTKNLEGAYITHNASDGLSVKTLYTSKAENMPSTGLATNASHENTIITYRGVSKIVFRVVKQYLQPGNDSAGTMNVLYYSIHMDSGYILSGNVTMFNLSGYNIVADPEADFSSYNVADTPYVMTIINNNGEPFDHFNNGIAFVKN